MTGSDDEEVIRVLPAASLVDSRRSPAELPVGLHVRAQKPLEEMLSVEELIVRPVAEIVHRTISEGLVHWNAHTGADVTSPPKVPENVAATFNQLPRPVGPLAHEENSLLYEREKAKRYTTCLETARVLTELPGAKYVDCISTNEQISIAQIDGKASRELVYQVAVFDSKHSVKLQEFLCLGFQNLTVLKDNVYCLSDYLVKGGKFVVDDRSSKWLDYSQSARDQIHKWADRRQGVLDPAPISMASARFQELPIRLGEPYVYIHQGDCEHIFIFTDIRAVTKNDEQDQNRYPVELSRDIAKRRKCECCKVYVARYICVEDYLCENNPTPLCEYCYHNLHYAEDGQLLHKEFQVYPYYHD